MTDGFVIVIVIVAAGVILCAAVTLSRHLRSGPAAKASQRPADVAAVLRDTGEQVDATVFPRRRP